MPVQWVRRTGSARDKADNCGSAAQDKADNYVYSSCKNSIPDPPVTGENIVISDISVDESVQPEYKYKTVMVTGPTFVPQSSTQPNLITQNELIDLDRFVKAKS
ncbi:hypothetical protein J6590_025633 [Homalodisca vitripennis]|nr:hypothetical protein J6590_025633 [Homalodisca vitripennis]